ncbi:hypothetical protein [Nitratireductor rhodophyticola]|uniref:hypothetical protein n=1 Tax=Nitratireductor rhodophyticola TaxID=2854036 RepID=UPI003008C840
MDKKFAIKLKSDDGQTDLDLNGDIHLQDADTPGVIAFGGFPVNVISPTTLRAFLSIGDDEPLEIATLPIKVAPFPSGITE